MPVSHIHPNSLPTSLPEGWAVEPPQPGDPEHALDELFGRPAMKAALAKSLRKAESKRRE